MIPPEQVLQNLMVSLHPLPETSPSGRVLPSLPYRLGQSRVERVWTAVNHLRAGNEQCGDEEGVRGEFDDPRLAGGAATADDGAGICQAYLVGRVQPVVAVVRLGDSRRSIEGCCACAGLDVYWLLLAHQRTGKWRDHQLLRFWIRLRVLGVLDPEDVARNLDDCVLEPASSAGEGQPALAGMADRRTPSMLA